MQTPSANPQDPQTDWQAGAFHLSGLEDDYENRYRNPDAQESQQPRDH